MPKSDDSELSRLRQENARLQKSLDGMEKQLSESNEANKELRALLKDLQEKLDILIVQMKKRNRRDFGGTTEKHNLRPALDSPPATTATPKKQPQTPTASRGKKHILDNAANLPSEPVTHAVKEEDIRCPCCAIETVFVGNLLTRQLESLSETVKILEHNQETRACPKCKNYIVTAEKPCPPIPGSYAGPHLLSEIIVGKLDDGLPNNRQQKMFKRKHAIIPRSTQCDWIQASSLTVTPLYELLKRELLASRVIQTDDSGIKIQDRKLKKNLRKGKMTVYIGDKQHKVIVFDFSPDLSFDKNKAFLKDFKGLVQADAAGGFDALFADGSKIEVGCHAHSRRRYYDCLVIEIQICNTILDTYGKLYDVERSINGKPPGERLAARQSKSKPLIEKLLETITPLKDTLNPTHPLMSAVNYTLNHWTALTRFLEDPDLEIDNNSSERAIKTWVLVRKNSLFAGSDAGAKAAAIHLSLIASAKRNGLDPVEYLTDVFTRINSMKISELHQLLPDRWARLRQ